MKPSCGNDEAAYLVDAAYPETESAAFNSSSIHVISDK